MIDIEHHFVEKGEGEALILLHGNGEDNSYFEHQTDVFAKHFRVFALDTRGHGKTPRGTAPFTIRQFALDLLAFMDRMCLPKAILLGFSDGGNIALEFALEHPERVSKLILDGANLSPSGVKRNVQIPIVIGYRVARFFSTFGSGAKQHAEMLGLMVNEPHVEPSALQRLTMPTLVIAGTNDMIKEEYTRLIASSIPSAKLAFVEGDHFVANKHPKEFNEVVLRFLMPS